MHESPPGKHNISIVYTQIKSHIQYYLNANNLCNIVEYFIFHTHVFQQNKWDKYIQLVANSVNINKPI